MLIFKNFKNIQFWVGLCSVLLAMLFYNCIFFNRYFPITEGWFSAYAHLIRSGQVPYRDFYLFLTPLYPMQIAGFQALFGESFIGLRILGIVVILTLSLFLYLIIIRRFTPLVSTVSTVTAMIYYQSGVAHITYDFIQLFTLYALAATYLIIRYSENICIGTNSTNKYFAPLLFFAGVMVSLAFLTKQSNGSLLVVFSIFAVIFSTIGVSRVFRIWNILSYMFGMLLPIIFTSIWLYIVGAFPTFMDQVFFGAIASKGSMGHILFSWMSLVNKDYLRQLLLILVYLLPLFILSLIGTVIATYKVNSSSGDSRIKDSYGILIFFILFISVVAFSYCGTDIFNLSSVAHNRELANYVIVVISTALITALMLSLIFHRFLLGSVSFSDRTLGVTVVMAIGLIFGNGTSAGLSEVSVFLGFSLALAYLMSLPNVYGIVKVVIIFICLSFILFITSVKFRQPYVWWYTSVPDVRTSVTPSKLPLLSGFWLPPETNELLESATLVIKEHSRPDDDVFTFPNIPGFYLLANRWPKSKVVVSWFDFLPDMPARIEAKRILTTPPAVIVNLKLPETTWMVHERLFRQGMPLGQRDIQDAIEILTVQNRLYLLEFSRELSPGLVLEIWHKKELI